MMDEKEWLVYKHTFPNGRVYYGITSREENERWKNGFGYRQNSEMFDAIVKYGWDNIKHEIITDGLSETQAKQIEKAFITSEVKGSTYNISHSSGQENYITDKKNIYRLCGGIPDTVANNIFKVTGYYPFHMAILNDRVVAYCVKTVDGEPRQIEVEAFYPNGRIVESAFIDWINSANWSICSMPTIAELEISILKARTEEGRKNKVRNGGYAGGKPPIGYKAVDGKLEIVPEEAEIVRLVFELRENGGTLMGIAEELNKRGYRTKKGGNFLHSAVQTILNNEDTYRGHYKYGKGSVENQHEPILK